MAELSNIEIPYPEYDAKNLFVRDDKKRNYYLITVKGDKRVLLVFAFTSNPQGKVFLIKFLISNSFPQSYPKAMRNPALLL